MSIAANVKVVQLPGLADKEDISDWLDQGHTLEELLDLVATAKDWESVYCSSPDRD